MKCKWFSLIVAAVIVGADAAAATFHVSSPGGKIWVTVTHDGSDGTLSYAVTSGGVAIIEASPLGITTDKAEFSSGLEFVERAASVIDETFTLPVGKVSTYVNPPTEPELQNGTWINYLNHPSKAFLKRVPATWDEVKFVAGYPASHTVIARRKGADWYVGGMTEKARTLAVPLSFLKGEGAYQAEIFRDREAGFTMVTETKKLGRSDVLTLAMLDRGGFVVRLSPLPAAQK